MSSIEFLIEFIQMLDDPAMRGEIVKAYVKQNGPIPDKYSDIVRMAVEGKMNDLIDRQKLLSSLHKFFKDGFTEDRWWNSTHVLAAIDKLPSAQPERKTGRWIYDNEAYPGGNPYGHYDCDQCGESVPYKTNFCPSCGAKMEVEHDK